MLEPNFWHDKDKAQKTIIEVFKKEKIDNEAVSFGNINDRLNNNNILKFY